MLTTVILSSISFAGVIGEKILHDAHAKHQNQIDLLLPSQLQLQQLRNGEGDDPQVGDDIDGLAKSTSLLGCLRK